jgi:hypothetical protein
VVHTRPFLLIYRRFFGMVLRMIARMSLMAAVLTAGLSVFLGSLSVRAQELGGPITVKYLPKTDTLDVTAVSVPLRDVLAAITAKTGIAFVLPPGMNPTISPSVQGLPLERAIKQLLGASRNTAMIYTARFDRQGREELILSQVMLLEGGIAASGSAIPVAAPVAPPVQKMPSLSPEELAARRAEKEARRAEKDKAKEEKQASRDSRRGGGNSQVEKGRSSESAPTQDGRGDVAAQDSPSSSKPGSTPSGSPRSPRRNR